MQSTLASQRPCWLSLPHNVSKWYAIRYTTRVRCITTVASFVLCQSVAGRNCTYIYIIMFRIGVSVYSKSKLVKPALQLSLLSKCTSFHTSTNRNEAQLISGTKIAGDIHKEVKSEIDEWTAGGRRAPKLAAVLVGDDPASATYIKNKVKACTKVGINSETINKPSTATQEEILQIVDSLNTSNEVDGILVQLPLPEHIDERTVCNAIVPEKDVDGFHITNIGRLCLDQECLMPATPAGVWEMIKRTGVETFAKIALVCGRSKNVGMPAAMLLHTDHRHERPGGDATVIQTHRYTPREHLKLLAQHADIIIAAAGVPGLITADMIKEGACVIDVGINRVKDKKTGKFKLVGDVDFEEVKKVAGFITPVPGGVGPMTVAMLCKNTLQAAKSLQEK